MRQQVHIRGATLAFDRLGEGAPVVFLHDWLGARHDWAPVCAELEGDRIALDLPGAGESDCPTGTYDLYFYARFVVGLLDQLHLNRFFLVGHGLGGAISLQIAHEQPERVGGVVAVAPSALPQPLQPWQRLLLGPAGRLTPPSTPLIRRVLQARDPDDPRLNQEDQLHAVCGALSRSGAWAAARHSLRTLLQPALQPQIDVLRPPVALLWGRQDHAQPLAHGEQLTHIIPTCSLTILEGGHALRHPEAVRAQIAAMVSNLKNL